jgi:hypothetical protein
VPRPVPRHGIRTPLPLLLHLPASTPPPLPSVGAEELCWWMCVGYCWTLKYRQNAARGSAVCVHVSAHKTPERAHMDETLHEDKERIRWTIQRIFEYRRILNIIVVFPCYLSYHWP